ncbi:tRNA-dihydrouridine(20) synthase -like [Oopsacas minuta]|uniref:General transcription factor IIF subunit 2 n=1 Tax=Oopsacas minuta TaxID=111878 RepID=A0AAV7JLJ7_9METZ|nr:tRNA-dihydrouridine(20) synthase -like [Oopsacas minuta]
MAEASQEATQYDVDTTNHARGLWLLKVPKYLSEQWANLDNGTDIGSIEFVKKPNSTVQNIVFKVSSDSVNESAEVPLTHVLKLSSSDQLSMMVFSQTKDEVKIEGKIAQKADIQVDGNYIKQYMLMKRKKFEVKEAEKKAKYDRAPISNVSNRLSHATMRHKEIVSKAFYVLIETNNFKPRICITYAIISTMQQLYNFFIQMACNFVTNQIDNRYTNKLILAPMVRMGTLPFRLLCLEYGSDIVFTEEIVDHKLIKCKRIINPVLNTIDFVDHTGCVVLRTCAVERDKVVLQIGTSCKERAVKIAELVTNDVSGIDVNMGCPKDFSVKGGMGIALLNRPDRITEIMTALVKACQIPVTCKIRILSTLDKTLELLKLIESTGVSAVSIHGRTSSQRRTEPNQNDILRAICNAHIVNIPLIANGMSTDVACHEDISKLNRSIGSNSIMLARAAQRNPSIFRKSGMLSGFIMAQRYLMYAIDYDNTYGNTLYCICNIMHSLMDKDIGSKITSSRSMLELSNALQLTEYYEQAITKRKSIYSSLTGEDRNNLEGLGLIYDSDKVLSIPEVNEEGVIELHVVYRKRKAKDDKYTPKELINTFSRKKYAIDPVYVTTERSADRRFKSVVCVGESNYSSSCWEKNKKLAEQAAATVAVQSRQKRERQEDKHLRSDKQIVLDRIFEAFRKNQYYGTNDLVSITKQPQNHLKDILKGVCKYRTHAPHKNTWELKPEYREDDKESCTIAIDDDDDDLDNYVL